MTLVSTLGQPLVDVLFDTVEAKQAARRTRREGPIDVFPGHWSNEMHMQRIKDQISREATNHPDLKENVDDLGRCYGSGVRSNFYGIRHINGFPMKNGTWPMVSNLGKREELGLTNEWVEPWHRDLFKAFTRLFFEDLHPHALKIRKNSSSVVPYFTKKPLLRQEMAARALIQAQAAGSLMMKGDYKEAYLAYQMGGAYYVVYRSQSTDKIEYAKGKWSAKDRYVADLDYAVSGGTKGSLFVSSKLLDDVDFRVMDGMFRERLRTAMGGPFQMNAAMMPVMQSSRKHIYDRYGFSFHHTTRKQKQEKIRKWDMAIAADVSDHDTVWPNHLYVPAFCEELLAMGFAPWWVAILEASFKLPIYVGAPAFDQGHTLLGDWRNPDINVGMPSGHSGTDLFGTLGMTFCYFLAMVENVAPHYLRQLATSHDARLRLAAAFMRGELEIGSMSKTDDAMLLGKGEAAIKMVALQARMKDGDTISKYMKISYEHGGAFLGDILLYDVSKQLKHSIFIGNLLSCANNAFSPEYGCQDDMKDRDRVKRPYPGIAWGSQKEVYGDCPGYGALMEITEAAWRDHTGESYTAFREQLYERDVARLAKRMASVARYNGLDHLTMEDKEVLVSSDKLEYKYEYDDINPEVVALSVFQVPIETTSTYLSSVTGVRY